MRDALTILAAIVSLILCVALAAPLFLDWTSLRAPIEERLTQAMGRPTTIAGRIDVRLLPAPYALVENVSIGETQEERAQADAADEKPFWRASAARMRLELALAPLLRGELDFSEARVERPRVEIRLGRNGAAGAPPSLPMSARFPALAVSDGELAMFDADGAPRFSASRIELKGSLDSLRGPFRGAGTFSAGGEDVSFRLAGGAVEGGTLPLKLSAQADGATLVFDGAASFAPQARLSGALSVEGAGARTQGALALTTRRVDLSDLALTLGEGPGALAAKGEAHVDLMSSPPAGAVSLTAERLDLDGFLAAGGPTPSALAPPFPLTLDWRIDSLAFGRAAFSDVSGALVLKEERAQKGWLRFSARGPRGLRLSLDGAARWSPSPAFDGAVRAEGRETGWLGAWLARIAPQARAPEISFSEVGLAAQAKWTPDELSLRRFELNVDETRLAGDFALSLPAQGAPRVEADVATPRLDLSGPFVAALRGEAASALRAAEGTLRLRVDEIAAQGSGSLGGLALVAEKAAGRVSLRELSWLGPDGASAQASGNLSDAGAELKGHAKIARGGALARALEPVVENEAQRRALARLAALTPVDLDVSLGAARDGDMLTLSALDAQGTVAGARVSARARPDGEALDVSLSADSRASLPLLQLAGLNAPGAPDPGPARLEASLRFDPKAARRRATLAASLGDAKLNFSGEVGADLAAPSASGALDFSTRDATPLLKAAGVASPDAKERFPAAFAADAAFEAGAMKLDALKGSAGEAKLSGALRRDEARLWTGSLAFERLTASSLVALVLGPAEPVKAGALWSSLAFAPPTFEPPRAQLTVSARELVLGPPLAPARRTASEARLQLSLAPGRLAVESMSFHLAGGEANGAFTLARAGAEASLSAKIEIAGARLDLPGARGRLDAGFELSGTGASAEALVASLAGAGSARVAELTLPRADPDAISRVVAKFDHEGQDLSAKAISAALLAELKRGELKTGERRFELAAKAGAIALSSPSPSPGAPALAATFDLRRGGFSQSAALSDPRPPKGWSGEPAQAVALAKGDPAAPTFEVDATALSNALAARALDREVARIEAFEYDLRERAFFRRRLAFDRRREAERERAAQEKAAQDKARAEGAEGAKAAEPAQP